MPDVSVTFKVVDQASPVINGISSAVDRLATSLGRVGAATGSLGNLDRTLNGNTRSTNNAAAAIQEPIRYSQIRPVIQMFLRKLGLS